MSSDGCNLSATFAVEEFLIKPLSSEKSLNEFTDEFVVLCDIILCLSWKKSVKFGKPDEKGMELDMSMARILERTRVYCRITGMSFRCYWIFISLKSNPFYHQLTMITTMKTHRGMKFKIQISNSSIYKFTNLIYYWLVIYCWNKL